MTINGVTRGSNPSFHSRKINDFNFKKIGADITEKTKKLIGEFVCTVIINIFTVEGNKCIELKTN